MIPFVYLLTEKRRRRRRKKIIHLFFNYKFVFVSKSVVRLNRRRQDVFDDQFVSLNLCFCFTINLNQRSVVICALIVFICQPSFGQAPCPVEEDPVQLAECAQLDIQAIIQAARGNLKLFCNLAERYMECFKTKTRNCIGGYVRLKFNVLLENIYYYSL
jgi:hypothetical protein